MLLYPPHLHKTTFRHYPTTPHSSQNIISIVISPQEKHFSSPPIPPYEPRPPHPPKKKDTPALFAPQPTPPPRITLRRCQITSNPYKTNFHRFPRPTRPHKTTFHRYPNKTPSFTIPPYIASLPRLQIFPSPPRTNHLHCLPPKLDD